MHDEISIMKPVPTTDREYILFGLRMVGEFGASIAVPVVVLAVIGQKLDDRWGTGWLCTILGFVLAALISAKIVHKKAKRAGVEYQALINTEKNIKKPTKLQ